MSAPAGLGAGAGTGAGPDGAPEAEPAAAGRRDPRAPCRVGQPTVAGSRDTEWLSALIMCLWALVLALPGDSLAGPSFSAFHRLGLTETFWSCAFGATGGVRLAALYINGRSPRTPYARMLGAFLGFLSWGQVGFLVYEGTMGTLGVVSPGVAVYGVLSAMELRSLYRASYDARYVSR